MNKKVIDINFPQKEEKKQNFERNFNFLKNRPLKTEIFSCKTSLVSCKKKKRLIFIFSILILIGFFSYLYFSLPRVKIEIWPKTENVNFNTELVIGERIEGKILKVEETINQQFPATEKFVRETRAEGIIRLYNNYSTTPQVLIERTRFISANGKLFRTPTRVVIPGKQRQAGRWVPGTIDIKVIADQPGEEFNINSTAFSIPGFLGSARFTAIYGESFQSMTGGKIEELVRVSEEDFKISENILSGKKRDVCLDILRNKISPEFYFLEEAMEVKVLEKTSNVETGTEVEGFNFSLKINCQVLTFKKIDIKNFAKNFIEQQISENKVIVPESLEIKKLVKKQNINKGLLTFSLNLTADIYSDINHFYLQENLIGKSLDETQVYLRDLLEVDKIYVNFWPFWVKSVPRESNRILIELKFEGVDSVVKI